MRYYFLLFVLLIFSCKTEQDKKKVNPVSSAQETVEESEDFETLGDLLGPLFADVQLAHIFPDSKTFVDCIAKRPYDKIKLAYEQKKNQTNFDLKTFVLDNFELPDMISSDFKTDTSKSAEEHVISLWPVLKRVSDAKNEGSTLIPLPQPYIVPGGRFREVYYWDSYFTMLGLAESGEFELIDDMLENFAHLIETVGHIPNGNRTYYITRSQPPFFSQMVALLAEKQGDSVYTKYRKALRKEYDFWMDGKHAVNTPVFHCVATSYGIMNRYFDRGVSPREESYREDYNQVQKVNGGEKMYSDLRSGAESGWDYSSRWFADGRSIETIITTDIIPVDLNSLLYGLEAVLLRCYPEDKMFRKTLENSMIGRKKFLNEVCWNASDGIYEDFNWLKQKQTGEPSLAMTFPLFFNMASQQQADNIAEYIENHFLKPGGVVTTLKNTGEQWDAPNGWAPLQWMTIIGLENYGHEELANIIAQRWVKLNEKVYANTGKFVEKYNVEDMTLNAGGGEYPVQDGFGWSNGVYLALKARTNKNK